MRQKEPYMRISIQTKKIVLRGVKCRRILQIDLFAFNQLPMMFLNTLTEPRVWKGDSGALVGGGSHEPVEILLADNGIVTEERFQEVVKLAEAAGKRLTNILVKLRKETQNWY